jgi:hypothetical protein
MTERDADSITGLDGYRSMLEGFAELTSLDSPLLAILINFLLAAIGVAGWLYLDGWLRWLAAGWIALNFYGAFTAATEVRA